jgi:hypothetical protein
VSENSSNARQHGVVFYESDNRFLCEAILDFCVRALTAQDPLVVIATRAHLTGLRRKLRERGFDWPQICLTGRAAEYDAEELLDQFSVNGSPDETRFREVMDGVMEQWAGRADGATLRAFGEMVDVLCRREQLDDAIRLEQMWNELAKTHRFTLLCAYSMSNLYREVNGSAYPRICDVHDHLVLDPEPSMGRAEQNADGQQLIM